jgi:hypothetical protein
MLSPRPLPDSHEQVFYLSVVTASPPISTTDYNDAAEIDYCCGPTKGSRSIESRKLFATSMISQESRSHCRGSLAYQKDGTKN